MKKIVLFETNNGQMFESEAEVKKYTQELEMTPEKYINELEGVERFIFDKLYAGSTSKKLYQLYEFRG